MSGFVESAVLLSFLQTQVQGPGRGFGAQGQE